MYDIYDVIFYSAVALCVGYAISNLHAHRKFKAISKRADEISDGYARFVSDQRRFLMDNAAKTSRIET